MNEWPFYRCKSQDYWHLIRVENNKRFFKQIRIFEQFHLLIVACTYSFVKEDTSIHCGPHIWNCIWMCDGSRFMYDESCLHTFNPPIIFLNVYYTKLEIYFIHMVHLWYICSLSIHMYMYLYMYNSFIYQWWTHCHVDFFYAYFVFYTSEGTWCIWMYLDIIHQYTPKCHTSELDMLCLGWVPNIWAKR